MIHNFLREILKFYLERSHDFRSYYVALMIFLMHVLIW